MAEEIKKILEAAIRAPSGENCQPWRFVVTGDVIEVYNVPERDQSLYNSGQRASYAANGAAIENLLIAASHFKYKTQIEYFPKNGDLNFLARITLDKNPEAVADPLYEQIFKRVTNRKPYKTSPLTAEQITVLKASGEQITEVQTDFVTDRDKIKILAKAGSDNEYIMLSNNFLHNFFFSHVNWTKREDEQKKVGFYLPTLELPPPARAMFKILSNWSVAKYLAALGFPKIVAAQNAKGNASSAAMGIITIKSTKPIDFLMAGRKLQRLWLKASAMQLYIQPLTGILFFKLKLLSGESHMFTSPQVEIINRAYENVKKIFGLAAEETPAVMFRIGSASAPSAQSSRFKIEEVVKIIPS